MGFVKTLYDGLSGKTGAKAAKEAGQLQSDSSKYAADISQKQYEQTRQDQMPWLNMGNAALQQLGAFTGISQQAPMGQQAPQQQQQQQQAAQQQAMPQQGVGSGGWQSNPNMSDLANIGGLLGHALKRNFTKGKSGGSQPPNAVTGQPTPQVPQVPQVGEDGQPIPSQGATGGGMPQYTDKWGDRLESAYTDGKLTGGLDPNNFETDPSYQFRKQQGMDGLQSSAAASGGLLSGAALKSLNRYNSDLASQEYGNAWSRDQAEKSNLYNTLSGNRSQDYNLWSGERTRQYNELANLAGVGQTTATNLGTFGANNAMNQGNAAIAGANAQANGIVGAAGARQQGFNNMIGLGMKATGMFI